MKGMKEGYYIVECRVVAADGRERAERTEDFHLPAVPAWWDNKFGLPEVSDIVPEPWTPMKKTPDGFEVWNRRVTLGEALQPSQIINGNVRMLPAPVKLNLVARGVSFGKVKSTKVKRTGISYQLPVQSERFTGVILLDAEFDGFMKYTVKMTPKGKATLDSLTLDIPIAGELATYYHHGSLGTPSAYAKLEVHKGYGQVPAEGLGLPFTHDLWLGNDEMGLQWTAESDQWWNPEDRKKVVQVLPSGKTNTLRVNIINKPVTLDRPVTYQWAIISTPMKPLNEEYLHHLRLAQSGIGANETLDGLQPDTEQFVDALVEAGVNCFGQWAWGNRTSVWNLDFGSPGYRPTADNRKRAKLFKDAVHLMHRSGINWVIVYAIWNCFADWPNVGELWKEQARSPLVPSLGGYLYCPQKPFADWYIAELRQTILDTDIDGVYLDSSPDPHLCSNLHHGCGYIDPEGNLHGTYPVFACREFHKRIYYLFHQEMKKGGLIYAHNSHFPFPAVESFVDVHHCGEGSSLSRDIAIPKFYGRPFGLPVSFTRWNNPIYPETRMHSWRFVLQMDSTIKAHPSMVISKKIFPNSKGYGRDWYFDRGYDTQGEPVYKIWQAQRRFPWKGAQWIPWWKIEPYATTGDSDLWTCMHLNPGKAAMVVVSSFKKEETTCDLKLNWQKLGFDLAKVSIVDAITDEKIAPQGDALKLKILENRWRMLYISPGGG